MQRFVAIFSNTATKFGQNLKYFEIWLQYWKILQQIAKRRTFGCNIENTATEGGATDGHGRYSNGGLFQYINRGRTISVLLLSNWLSGTTRSRMVLT